METEITLDITLVSPPDGVGFCIQKGKDELVEYVVSTGKDITFGLSAKVKEGKDGSPNFSGDFIQGTPRERFVYICSGKRAGQLNTPWERRTKIHLSGITWAQIKKLNSSTKYQLAASYNATDKDGGPSCASVPLLGGGWKVKDQ